MTGLSDSGQRTLPRLHIVTDDAVLADPGFRERSAVILRAGCDRVALHLRGHRTSGRVLAGYAEHCVSIARRSGAFVLVNDRVDVALAFAADGVQLGSRSLPVTDARALLGARRVIGVSVHSLEEARHAAEKGADFLVAGTLYTSMSHPGRQAAGISWLKELSRSGPPVIGIGGIEPADVPAVLDAGAYGVAAIRGIWAAESLEAALADYLERLSGG